MRAWINQLNTAMLFDQDTFATVCLADNPNVNHERVDGIERANFVEQWIKTNKAAEVTFDGKPWPKAGSEKAVMQDFGKAFVFEICRGVKAKTPTFCIDTQRGDHLFLEIYSRTDKQGRCRAHVRIRESKDGVPSFILLDH